MSATPPTVQQAVPTIRGKAYSAAKWSVLTELLARTIAPVTQLLLARILAPEAFGVVATILLVTSFAEMLSDAGFQKYLVQHECADDNELDETANVAFWSSMLIAILLWAIIVVFRDPLAALVGNPGLGVALAIAGCSLPMTVCTGTQQALFRRAFEYRRVLPIRVGCALVMLVVSVPLAMLGWGYWSLLASTLSGALVSAIAFTVVSPWKPRIFYSVKCLRNMFSFSSWSLLESISIWLSVWSGTMVVSALLTARELGLYRQPMTVVNAGFAVITAATTPILFAALSRLQNDGVGFREFFFRFQFIISLFVLPIGVGIFCFREFIVEVMFGAQWVDASLMLGVWSLSTGFMIVLSHYCSEVYRSLGQPRVSLFSQILYMAVMIPVSYIAAGYGFYVFVIANSAVRVVGIVINQLLTARIAKIGFIAVMGNLGVPLLLVAAMALIALPLASASHGSWAWSSAAVVACALFYLACCLCFSRTRRALLDLCAGRISRGGEGVR